MTSNTQTHPRGAISTSHYLATEAGAAALNAGGTAIDAALAAAATLCVVYPNNVALGGDLVALVRDPSGKIHFLNATGPSAADQTLDALREKHGEQLPLRGIDSVSLPGGVCGWNSLHEIGAKLPWADHFEAARHYAREGFPNSKSVAQALIDERSFLEQDPGAREIFYPGGQPLAEGETLTQPALAATFDALATGGSEEFYEGELARRWIAGLQAHGSKLSLEDAKNYSAQWDEPIESDFEEHRVITGPPNTSGFMLLRALQEIANGIEDPLGSGAGELAHAFAAANAVRAAHLGDPGFGTPNGADLIAMQAPDHPQPGVPKPSGDTVGLSAVSEDGWAISLINSVYYGFGAGILDPDTGILFQNRGTSFSLDADAPNAFEPSKRPRHTLMPVLIEREGELAWVPATMGGSAQPQIHTQLLLRSLAGATPHEATHAPRWIVEEPAADGTVTILVEEDVPLETRTALEGSGLRVKIVPPRTEDLGHSNLIRVTSAGYDAASDPRSDGSAIIVSAQGARDERQTAAL
ncbi:gamma-glutamyltransferase family protein [Leucobacter salsicius]|uniref:gamma-glutamyltransferase family protein n=1 Tax=Leucobacter salsicius TaxID=664638 RepID=UPI0003455A20|nr:gamma-glutamyltransferase [Leucobacter salsicius]